MFNYSRLLKKKNNNVALSKTTKIKQVHFGTVPNEFEKLPFEIIVLEKYDQIFDHMKDADLLVCVNSKLAQMPGHFIETVLKFRNIMHQLKSACVAFGSSCVTEQVDKTMGYCLPTKISNLGVILWNSDYREHFIHLGKPCTPEQISEKLKGGFMATNILLTIEKGVVLGGNAVVEAAHKTLPGGNNGHLPGGNVAITQAIKQPTPELDLLLRKPNFVDCVSIMITNRCNMTCGGCHQACNINKKPYDITLDDFRHDVKCIGKNLKKHISLFGGEACFYPEYNKLIEIMSKEFPEYQFHIWSNGTTTKRYVQGDFLTWFKEGLAKHGMEYKKDGTYFLPAKINNNITIITCLRAQGMEFYPIFVAPKDIEMPPRSNAEYAELAKKNCKSLKECNTLIYGRKWYVCEVAACMDYHSYNLANGIEIRNDEPRSYITNEQVRKQLELFCPRCHACLCGFDKFHSRENIRQYINMHTMTTDSNIDMFKK